MFSRLALLGAILMASAGCAQMQFVKGHGLKPSETVRVVTLPAGATATSSYGQSCTTPCYLPLLRAEGGDLTVSLDGFRTERFTVTSSVSDHQIARRSTQYLAESIDPDPVSLALTAVAGILDGRGGVMELDQRDYDIELIPLAPGEEDLLAESEPITGERIAIDISEAEAKAD